MRVLIATNVVFDVFERRQPDYSASNHILKLARRGSIAAAVASQTIANCFYIYRKAVLSFVRDDLLETLDVAAGDAHQVKICLNLGIKDSEDALQIAAAMDWKASFIITGNVRDFKRSPIPALAPAVWIKRFEPDFGN